MIWHSGDISYSYTEWIPFFDPASTRQVEKAVKEHVPGGDTPAILHCIMAGWQGWK